MSMAGDVSKYAGNQSTYLYASVGMGTKRMDASTYAEIDAANQLLF